MDQFPQAVTAWHLQPPTLDERRDAAALAAGQLVRTPLLESERVNRSLGGCLLLKAEGLQRTGSFKARGALDFMGGIPEADRSRGVVYTEWFSNNRGPWQPAGGQAGAPAWFPRAVRGCRQSRIRSERDRCWRVTECFKRKRVRTPEARQIASETNREPCRQRRAFGGSGGSALSSVIVTRRFGGM